ncbi:MAG TPA: glycosyltransferase [Terriglobales bacterium]|nr:glycosyltransferase [Terriglobales bacterium]
MTIVIPAKNEATLLPRLLTSLTEQDYAKMRNTKVYLADAGSTDGTPEIARSFAGRLDIEVIPGGLPATGRNNGARLAVTPYVLFIDADIELADRTLVRRAVENMWRKQLHCLTTNISCPLGSTLDRFLYGANNVMQHLSRLTRPFSTGMFMLLDRERFAELGGFHEGALFAEDYMLSKKVARNRFGIVRGSVVTTNRRFRKMGHFRIVRLFVRTALNTWNDSFFLRDHKYWHSEA